MPLGRTISVTTSGVVSDPQTGAAYFVLPPDGTDFFLGVGGTYSGLTLQVQGGRGGNFYDIATYTTDDVGPLATPLSPADNAEIAYTGDCRKFTQLQITILSVGSISTLTLEVMAGSFFPPRTGASLSGGNAQIIYELRALRSTLTSWLGTGSGPLLNLQNELLGSGVGKSFPN